MPTPALNLLLRTRRPVLSRAVGAWLASRQLPTGRGLTDLAGNGLHAFYGGNSTTPTTNDPLRLRFADGGKRLYFPGVALNHLSLPSSNRFSGATELEIIIDATADDWGRAARDSFCGAWDTTQQFVLSTLGAKFRIDFSGSSGEVNIPAEFVDEQRRQLRFYWSSSPGDAVFQHRTTSSDAWVTIGTLPALRTIPFAVGNSPFFVGTYTASGPLPFLGSLHNFTVRTTIGGADLCTIDASRLAEPYASYTDPQGNVWTLNRSASGRKLAVVDRDLLLLGTDDYLSIADSPLLNFGVAPFTAVVAWRKYGSTFAANATLIGKRIGLAASAGNAGWNIRLLSASSNQAGIISDGTNFVSKTGAFPRTGIACISALRRGAGTVSSWGSGADDSSADTGVGSLSNASALTIGQDAGLTSPADMEFIGAAIFRERLTDVELLALVRELGVAS